MENTGTGTQARQAPYAPPATVLMVIRHFRNRDVPEQIEKVRFTQIGVTDGLLNRTWSAFQFLGLMLEDGTTTEAFRALRYADNTEYPTVFQGILRQTYADIFAVVQPEYATDADYERAYRPYSPGGQRGRMITQF
mgnify:CR=1 FL=1